MHGNAVQLRTRLFAAVGALALLAWGATLFGFGSRLGAPASVVEAPALPVLPAADTLAALAPDNAEALARPLFANDRRPHPFVIGGNGPTSPMTLRLNGVLLTPTLEMATLTTEQGRSLRLRVGGPPQDGWQLLSLRSRSAEVSGPAGILELKLEVSDSALVVGGKEVPKSAAVELALQAGSRRMDISEDQIQDIRRDIEARRRIQSSQQRDKGRSDL